MFLLEINLQSFESSAIKRSNLRFHEGPDFQSWIDGWIGGESNEGVDHRASGQPDGVFNLVYISMAERRLLISNDPLGQRPLYYYEGKERLYVASCFWDLVSIASNEGASEVNEKALQCLLSARRIIPSHHTLDRAIFVLPAGARLVKRGDSSLVLSHVSAMQQVPDNSITADDAALELLENMRSGLKRIKSAGLFDSFWFGNSGGLDSRLIPPLANEVGLRCNGFLISGDRIPGLANQSKLSSLEVAKKFGIENKIIDYTPTKSTRFSRLMRDILVNPLGPANYHKNAKYWDFTGSLILNGGNAFLVANENNGWKKYVDTNSNALLGYFSEVLVRKGGPSEQLSSEWEEDLRSEIDSLVELTDDFSVCRTLHQKYLNKTSPMGAFESMNWIGDFHYLYYHGLSSLNRHWPRQIFFNRQVQYAVMRRFYPALLDIADQSGAPAGRSPDVLHRRTVLDRVRGNGLNYRLWIRRRWFQSLLREVEGWAFMKSNPRATRILMEWGTYKTTQDMLDMVKLAVVVGMIDGGILPDNVSSQC